jgi:uncharacterized protein
MKALVYIIAGTAFGIVMAKSEAISWFRIQEMFRFQDFHMYGIIGTAVVLGALGVWLIKKYKMRDFSGNLITFNPKEKTWTRYLVGGIFFGLGWALTGACPGPLFVNLGYGFYAIGIAIIGALLGTWLYGLLRDKLPH